MDKSDLELRGHFFDLAEKEFFDHLEACFAKGATLDSFPPHYLILRSESLGENKAAFFTDGIHVVKFAPNSTFTMFDVGVQIKPHLETENAMGVFFFVYGERLIERASTESKTMIFMFFIVEEHLVGVCGYPIEGETLQPRVQINFVPDDIHELILGLTIQAH